MSTIDNEWGKGVIYAAPIDLAAQKPLDSRIAVQTITERDEHVTNNRAYEGMKVYVADNSTTYVYKNGNWVVDLDADAIVNDLTTGGTNKVLSAEQGKILKQSIDNISAGELSVPIATEEKIGGIKSSIGIGKVTVATDGTASVSSIDSASKLSTSRTITLTGDASGSVEFDGSQNVSIDVTVADDSHNHIIDNIDGLQDALDLKAPLASPSFTGTPTAPTPDKNINTTQIATTAFVHTLMNDHMAEVANAVLYKGKVSSAEELPSNAEIGWMYKAASAFTLGEEPVEEGDQIICASNVDGNTPTWDVYQANVDGVVIGPESAVNEHIVVFDGSTGKSIKDSGFTIAQSIPGEDTWKFGDEVTTSKKGLMSSSDKSKLDAIANGAEVNQNAFSNVFINSTTTVSSDSKTDTLNINSTNGIEISAEGKTITFKGTTYPDATTSSSGLMSASDKTKLEGIEEGAQVNVKPDWSAEAGSPAEILNKPTSLKNPYTLSITVGSAKVDYDGSAAKGVSITSEGIGAIPITSGTTNNVVLLDNDGKSIKDSGFAIPKPETTNTGDFLKVNADGAYELSVIQTSDVEGLNSSLDSKASKLAESTENNVATIAANGSYKDSGTALSALATKQSVDNLSSVVDGKVGKPDSYTPGNFVKYNPVSGKLEDMGFNEENVADADDVKTLVTSVEELGGRITTIEDSLPSKIEKVSEATLNNIAVLKEDGSIADGGKSISDITNTTDDLDSRLTAAEGKITTLENKTVPVATTTTVGGVKSASAPTKNTLYVDAEGNATIESVDTAEKLAIGRTITLSGAVTGNVSFDGSKDVEITTSVNHTHPHTEITDWDTELAKKADVAGATFTGAVHGPEPSVDSNDTTLATTSFVNTTFSNKIQSSGLMTIKGSLGQGGTVGTLPSDPKVGWAYEVVQAGTYDGYACEIGDLIICTGVDPVKWLVSQANVDGAVVNESKTSIEGNLLSFSSTDGVSVEDSGIKKADVTNIISNAPTSVESNFSSDSDSFSLSNNKLILKLRAYAPLSEYNTFKDSTNATLAAKINTVAGNANNIAVLDGNGQLSDSNIAITSLATNTALADLRVFSQLTVDTTPINPSSNNDTNLKLISGSNILISVKGKEITIAGNYQEATTSSSGLMSASDKTKLDSIGLASVEDIRAIFA